MYSAEYIAKKQQERKKNKEKAVYELLECEAKLREAIMWQIAPVEIRGDQFGRSDARSFAPAVLYGYGLHVGHLCGSYSKSLIPEMIEKASDARNSLASHVLP